MARCPCAVRWTSIAPLAWRSRKLDFADTPLLEAIEEANRYSTRKVELRAPALAAAKISGVFDAGHNDAFADALRAYFGLTVRRESGTICSSSRRRSLTTAPRAARRAARAMTWIVALAPAASSGGLPRPRPDAARSRSCRSAPSASNRNRFQARCETFARQVAPHLLRDRMSRGSQRRGLSGQLTSRLMHWRSSCARRRSNTSSRFGGVAVVVARRESRRLRRRTAAAHGSG